MKRLLGYTLALFICAIIVSCDSDIRKMGKKMNEDRMNSFLKNQESERIHTSDSVRRSVAEYAHNLPKSYDKGISLSSIDTVSVKGNVWCKLYFNNESLMDSVSFVSKVDSILNNMQPYKGWIKYGRYSMNVELWCYEITHTGDTVRFTTIPHRNY